MSTVNLTTENFEELVTSNETVLVDWWAPWCGPCRSFGPVYEQVSEEHPEIIFAKINTEEQPELASAFGIMSIPTLMVFRERILLFSEAGALPANLLSQLVANVAELDMEDVRRQMLAEQEVSSDDVSEQLS